MHGSLCLMGMSLLHLVWSRSYYYIRYLVLLCGFDGHKPASLALVQELAHQPMHLVQPVLLLPGPAHIHHVALVLVQEGAHTEHGGVLLTELPIYVELTCLKKNLN